MECKFKIGVNSIYKLIMGAILFLMLFNLQLFAGEIVVKKNKDILNSQQKEEILESLRRKHFPQGYIPNEYSPMHIIAGCHHDNKVIERMKEQWLKETEGKINKYLETHPDTNKEISHHLKNAEISEGMLKEEVMLIWGTPPKMYENNKRYFNADEIWEYHILWYMVQLFFKEDRLIKIVPFETDIMY